MSGDQSRESLSFDAARAALQRDDAAREQQRLQERLRQRAVQYAAPLKTPEDTHDTGFNVLTFDLGDERYSVDVHLVRSVRPVGKIAPVPGLPRFYTGVVNLRGTITTILDLRVFFELSAARHTPAPELIVIHNNNLELGLLATHVWGVLRVSTAEIEPMDEMRYARGVTAAGLVLLDMQQLLNDERLIIGGTSER